MSNQKPTNNKLALVKKNVIDVVAAKVHEFTTRGELDLPPDYSPANAMKAAWLTLQQTVDKNKKSVLTSCTQNSIANALLSMVVQGLTPAKQQCYFIAFGDQLTLMRSYFGAMAVARRVDPTIADFAAEVVYEGDTLRYEIVRGKKVISKHEQDFGNINKKKIIGAYCLVIGIDGTVKDTVLMTMDEIKQAWRMSKTNPVTENGTIKVGSTHDKFTADMCKKTVINKTCKPIINSSSDATILGRVIRETEGEALEAEFKEEVAENANRELISLGDGDQVDPETGEVLEEPLQATGTDGQAAGGPSPFDGEEEDGGPEF